MNIRFRRASTLTVAAAVALAGTALTPVAYAKDAPGPSKSAAQWQAGQLTKGAIHNDQYGFDDYGLTIDTLFALKAARVAPKQRNRIIKKLRANVESYIGDGSGGTYAGSIAKTLVAATATRARPRHFGGVNLVRRTRGLIVDSGSEKGRLKDDSASDYSNLIGQAYALRGLAAVGVNEPSVKTFLLKQQCPAGHFRISYNDKANNPGVGCASARPANRKADLDATAIAVQSMVAARAAGVGGLGKSINRAANWLKGKQRRNGAFRSGKPAAANSNSTGLAGHALALTGRKGAAWKAATWIASRQATRSRAAGTKLRGDVGAVGFNEAALQRGRKQGIRKTTADQWRRATAQAVLGLTQLQARHFKVKAGKRKVLAGKRVRVRAHRLTPGEKFVVAVAGKARRHGRANKNGRLSIMVRVPRSTKPGRRTIAVRGAAGARVGKAKIRVRRPRQPATDATNASTVSGTATSQARKGYAGKCTRKTRRGRKGVTVVVDFRKLGKFRKHKGKTIVRCAPARFTKKGKVKKRTGIKALRHAGVKVKGTRMSGKGFVCRLDGRPAPREKLRIKGDRNYREKCIRTPPTSAYWAYWHSGPKRGPWRFSKSGPSGRYVKPGGFEGWSFALNTKRNNVPKPRVRPRR